jgi:hypothetical protein
LFLYRSTSGIVHDRSVDHTDVIYLGDRGPGRLQPSGPEPRFVPITWRSRPVVDPSALPEDISDRLRALRDNAEYTLEGRLDPHHAVNGFIDLVVTLKQLVDRMN